jgi:protein-S-isoprenylcysteine O-methyltransferase Ste14
MSKTRIRGFFLRFAGFTIPLFQFWPAWGIFAGVMSLPFIAYLISLNLFKYLWTQIFGVFFNINFLLWQPIWIIPTGRALELLLMRALALGGLILTAYSFIYWLRGRNGLIVSGPYRLVRHPQYLGIIIMTLGITLHVLNTTPIIPWIGGDYLDFTPSIVVYIWLAEATAYILLALLEEKYLTTRYRYLHRQYKKAVPFLIPWIRIPTQKNISRRYLSN